MECGIDLVSKVAQVGVGSNDIIIQIMSIMLSACFLAIIGLCGFIILLVKYFRSDMKEAWGYVRQLSEAISGRGEDIAVIKDIAQRLDRRDRRD